MEAGVFDPLVGWEFHGFRTAGDLDIRSIFNEAKTRWLRPNEIHAILCNYTCLDFNLTVNLKPVIYPQSGTILLYDRSVLRNFRKDGYVWKKKNDGKTVKEAHERLKVSNEERLHVYYAHGDKNPSFVRRCYWLLDKQSEHIVFVHYRDINEVSPNRPAYANSSSYYSETSVSRDVSEEYDSVVDYKNHTSVEQCPGGENFNIKNHEWRLHEINTLEWEDLLIRSDDDLVVPGEDKSAGNPQHINDRSEASNIDNVTPSNYIKANYPTENISASPFLGISGHFDFPDSPFQKPDFPFHAKVPQKSFDMMDHAAVSFGTLIKDGLHANENIEWWMNCISSDSPKPQVYHPSQEFSASNDHESVTSGAVDGKQSISLNQMITLTDISPEWAFSNEETKVLLAGIYNEKFSSSIYSTLFCVCGSASVPVEIVQIGVFRCLLPPHAPGPVNIYLSFDGHTQISQMLRFEYRVPISPMKDLGNYMAFPTQDRIKGPEYDLNSDELQVQLRLANILFRPSNMLDILCSEKPAERPLNKARRFALRTAQISNSWVYLTKSILCGDVLLPRLRNGLFELALKLKLVEWLFVRIVDEVSGVCIDDQGQGAIHLCAILGYTWAAILFSWSGISIDFRDKHGWTALHWAAYCGREEMVAALLAAGAKPNMVTDPTTEHPGGCTAADLASQRGYEGLGAYLSESSLVEHFKDMSLAGHVNDNVSLKTPCSGNSYYLNGDDDLCMKETLAAYRTAANAASYIHLALRSQSLKLRIKEAEMFSETSDTVAALRIQHAFRGYGMHKRMMAAAQIQHKFRTWKTRRQFLNMRRQATKIQAVFRGFRMRRRYSKIIWSVGVVEKAILRWRLRKRGLRGVYTLTSDEVDTHEGLVYVTDEIFFRESRKLAEERVERSVVRVQAMFRSKKAQKEYQRIKFAHEQAKVEYKGLMLDAMKF